MEKRKKTPSLWLSLVPFVCLILLMLPSVIVLGADPQIPLLVCTGITAAIGIGVLGYSWDEIEKSMIETNALAMQANFIIMLVGCLVGSWIAGGIVPGLIYYGLQIFTPSVFLACLPLMCAVISMSTGSAWTTASTIGVAAMGVAAGLGIPYPVAAGAIITGSQFGDKMSPLSDSTNLAAGVTETNLFAHIRHMMWTTMPSFILATALFALIGLGYSADDVDASQIQMICDTLQANFQISPWILIAPGTIILMMVLKVPAIPGIAAGTAVGVVFALMQGNDIGSVISQLVYGFEISSGSDMVDQLLSRGG
ncbi:MAG: Na+/H+ antiporter NhaC family protein, partial [Anaerovoracaceae bacterium]